MPLPNREPTVQMKVLPPDVRAGKGVFAKSVGAFVPKVTAAVFQKFGFHSAEIMSSWETIVGPELARLTRPQSIKWPRGVKSSADETEDVARAVATLTVATDPAFALDVSYRHREIIDRINRYFGYRAIGQIKVQQVPRVQTPDSSSAPAPSRPPIERLSTGSGDLVDALEALGRSVSASRAR